jgi:ribosomal protein S18 acetylase RimI-like enzyme
MQLQMRKAEPADLPVVRHITDKAYAVWTPVLGHPPQPVVEDHAPRIARGEVTLACEDSDVAGLIVVESNDGHDLIFSVAVDPDHAGKGIGPRLIAEAELRAKANGQSCMRLYTNALMRRNITLYLKLGYVETGRRPHPSRPDSTIVDMEKRF